MYQIFNTQWFMYTFYISMYPQVNYIPSKKEGQKKLIFMRNNVDVLMFI